MIKKILFFGISFVTVLSGLFGIVLVDNSLNENTKVVLPDGDDDDEEGVIETEDGVMFLSIMSINFR